MWELYVLPWFWELVVLKNYFYLEIYTLFFVAIILYFAMKRYSLREVCFVAISVIFYKYITINLFGWSCCTLQTNYFPTLWELNILIWVLTFWNILWGLIFARSWITWKGITYFIGFSYIFSIVNESIIQTLWLRIYSDDLISLLSGIRFLWLNLETYIYIFVWVVFMTSIYRYLHSAFEVTIEKKHIPRKKKLYIFSCIWVILTEILLHPQFLYSNLPDFGNIYQDINILIILVLWTLVFMSIYFWEILMEKYIPHISWNSRFLISVSINFLLYALFYWFLSFFWYFNFMTEWLMWWINIFGLPIEFFSFIIIINIFIGMFVRSYSK